MNAISDCHLSPGEEFGLDLRGDQTVFVGDTFDLIPYGLKGWKTIAGMRTVRSVLDRTDAPIFVAGNHDPLRLLRKILPVECTTVRSYDWGKYRFIHGHQFSEWRWISRLSPLMEWLTTNDITRAWWYKFCQSQGWMATGIAHSSEKHNRLVEIVWSWANYEADKAGKVFVIGHTHEPARFDSLIDLGSYEVTTLT